MLKQYDGTNFVTGMRAYASLAVLMIHMGGFGLRSLGEIGNWIADLGQAGVYVFFVISGFSVSASAVHWSGFGSFIAKRLWRIAPLYFAWILFSAAFILPTPATLTNVLLHLTFLSFLDPSIANSILSVEWTIPIEVFWYLFLPAIFFWFRQWIALIALLLFCGAATIWLLHDPFPNMVVGFDKAAAIRYSPLPYGVCFVAGIAAFRFRQVTRSVKYAKFAFCSCLAALIAYCGFPHEEWFYGERLMFFTAISAVFLMAGRDDSFIERSVLIPKPVQFCGAISYDLYLCHCAAGVAVFQTFPNSYGTFFGGILGLLASIALASVTFFIFKEAVSRIPSSPSYQKKTKGASA